MSLITKYYFKGDIMLTSGQLDNITSWIATYEDDILNKLLGYKLNTLLQADLNGTSEPTSQRFKDLVDGNTFTFNFKGNSITKKFNGIRNKTMLNSLISYYVYYQYRNETEDFNSGSGQKHSSTENSIDVDVRPKLISSWNKIVELYGAVPYNYCDADFFINSDTYIHYNSYASVYNYLLSNLETYPEWVFEPIEKQNIWGI